MIFFKLRKKLKIFFFFLVFCFFQLKIFGFSLRKFKPYLDKNCPRFDEVFIENKEEEKLKRINRIILSSHIECSLACHMYNINEDEKIKNNPKFYKYLYPSSTYKEYIKDEKNEYDNNFYNNFNNNYNLAASIKFLASIVTDLSAVCTHFVYSTYNKTCTLYKGEIATKTKRLKGFISGIFPSVVSSNACTSTCQVTEWGGWKGEEEEDEEWKKIKEQKEVEKEGEQEEEHQREKQNKYLSQRSKYRDNISFYNSNSNVIKRRRIVVNAPLYEGEYCPYLYEYKIFNSNVLYHNGNYNFHKTTSNFLSKKINYVYINVDEEIDVNEQYNSDSNRNVGNAIANDDNESLRNALKLLISLDCASDGIGVFGWGCDDFNLPFAISGTSNTFALSWEECRNICVADKECTYFSFKKDFYFNGKIKNSKDEEENKSEKDISDNEKYSKLKNKFEYNENEEDNMIYNCFLIHKTPGCFFLSKLFISGDSAKSNAYICEEDCLLSEWSEWSICSNVCNYNEKQIRNRYVKKKEKFGGKKCSNLTEERFCFQNPLFINLNCPEDCIMSEWEEWSACSLKFEGVKERKRTILKKNNQYGKKCTATKMIRSCRNSNILDNKINEEHQPTITSPSDSLSSLSIIYSQWSDCSSSCFIGGFRRRHRKNFLNENSNTKSVENFDAPFEQVETCNEHIPCFDSNEFECIYSEWTEWDKSFCNNCEEKKKKEGKQKDYMKRYRTLIKNNVNEYEMMNKMRKKNNEYMHYFNYYNKNFNDYVFLCNDLLTQMLPCVPCDNSKISSDFQTLSPIYSFNFDSSPLQSSSFQSSDDTVLDFCSDFGIKYSEWSVWSYCVVEEESCKSQLGKKRRVRSIKKISNFFFLLKNIKNCKEFYKIKEIESCRLNSKDILCNDEEHMLSKVDKQFSDAEDKEYINTSENMKKEEKSIKNDFYYFLFLSNIVTVFVAFASLAIFVFIKNKIFKWRRIFRSNLYQYTNALSSSHFNEEEEEENEVYAEDEIKEKELYIEENGIKESDQSCESEEDELVCKNLKIPHRTKKKNYKINQEDQELMETQETQETKECFKIENVEVAEDLNFWDDDTNQ